MDIRKFKELRRHYGALASLRIFVCQTANVDVFACESHLCELVEEHGMGKVERFTSKKLFQIAEDIVTTIKEQEQQMLSLAESRHKRFIHKVFSKQ